MPVQRRRSLFIDPGSPWQNAWIESFNGRLRDELLNGWHFDSLLEARVIIEDWRIDYNANRPHTAHGDLTPTEFAQVDHHPPTPSRIAPGPPNGSPSAGPLTLQSHLARQGLPVPSTSTIRRILHHHDLIEPQPRKRPKSSYIRFAAEQPNECWQSDFTHWTLADGTDTEILNWLDDHSRYLLACTAYRRVNGGDVVASFTETAQRHGLPASTLTDNGSVYTARFTHGHNDFERLLEPSRV